VGPIPGPVKSCAFCCRYSIGALGVLIVFLGLRAVFPAGEDWIGSLFRALRYAALGFWIAYGAPRMFALLRA
jgi:hypothetical protein